VKDNLPNGAIFEIIMPALEYELQDTFSWRRRTSQRHD
jgi:hypothetical protein